MAQSSVTRAFEPTRLRSIFISVRPAPRRLSERRAILRTLKRYGDIEVFQPLTDPAAFNAVATKATTAQQLVESSPLQFDYVPEPTTTTSNNQDSSTTGAGGVPRDIHSLHKAMGSKSDNKQSFVLSIFPGDTEHRYQVQKSPIYGPWPEERPCGPVESFARNALTQVVPADMAARGLRDWETGGQARKAFDRNPHADRSSLARAIKESRVARRREGERARETRSRGNLLQTVKVSSSWERN
ncbi:hypothetical protein GE09DRAFT_140083 [Coniochaeta sp. 2T2.1]|nr:hypothetical protein GE09DRAFT_140083 [Coniochaeta sp. 2T2.1]